MTSGSFMFSNTLFNDVIAHLIYLLVELIEKQSFFFLNFMQEKAQFEIEKLRQSTDVKAKRNEDSNHGSQLPSSPLKKVSLVL